ncbi:MAG: hypothetical protein SFT93_04990 [Rickettsiaceae bacterium]|nr:hypothetical protein [Rickettsiaceae bacterium]
MTGTLSSPRRRVSREYKYWIPASAGMTKVVAGMTITVSSPRKRGSSKLVIPSKEGIQEI